MRKERFTILLAILLLLFALRPLLMVMDRGVRMLDFLTIIFFLFCINAISDKRRHIYISSILLGLSLTARIIMEGRLDESLKLFFHIFYDVTSILFLLYTSTLILSYVVKGSEVTRDRIAAAICVYLLMGLTWSAGYRLMYVVDPKSFDLSEGTAAASIEERDSRDFNYFSYVTLTTLGYGDITPKTSLAKHLAALEAIIGQIYIAVLIACLVGQFIAQGRPKKG